MGESALAGRVSGWLQPMRSGLPTTLPRHGARVEACGRCQALRGWHSEPTGSPPDIDQLLSGEARRRMAAPWGVAAGASWIISNADLCGRPSRDHEGPCVELGYALVGLMGASVASAEELEANATTALDLAHRFGDRELECKALGDSGLALVSMGRIRDGMARLDEAFIMITSGESTDPSVVGPVLCDLLSSCDRCGDATRAESWLRVIERNAPRRRTSGPSLHARRNAGRWIRSAGAAAVSSARRAARRDANGYGTPARASACGPDWRPGRHGALDDPLCARPGQRHAGSLSGSRRQCGHESGIWSGRAFSVTLQTTGIQLCDRGLHRLEGVPGKRQ